MVKRMKAMKKILFFAAIAALAAVSCAKETAVNTEKFVIKASFAETKTVLAEGTKTHWTPGDQISVFNAGKGNCLFKTDITENTAAADFYYLGGEEYFDKPEEYFCFYPYNKNISTTDFVTFKGLEIPAVQTPVENGFDPKAALCFGRGNSANVAFENLTALLKFTVDAEEVYNVRVYATWGSKFGGSCTFDGTTLTASVNQVQLKGVMRKGKTFYMAVAPGTYETLDVYVDNMPYSSLNRTNKTLEAGKIYDMGKLGNARVSATKVVDWYRIDENNFYASTITREDLPEEYQNLDIEDVNANDPIKGEAQLNRGSRYRIYYTSEDGATLTSGSDVRTVDDTSNRHIDGQFYAILYSKWGAPIYFNIDWETKYEGQNGVHPLVDVRDRNISYKYQVNRSYYDANNRMLVLDLASCQEGRVKLFHGKWTRNY